MDKNTLSQKAIQWIANWFKENDRKTAVLGISGGKDSAVVAAMLVQAIGAENVVGVMMPNGVQKDIDDSRQVVEALALQSYTINIEAAYTATCGVVAAAMGRPVSTAAAINIGPRLRMTTLYTVAQTLSDEMGAKACVIGTGNAAELFVGYCTKWGDMASDMNPLKNLWVEEVLQIGDELGYFPNIIHKAPADGLSGKSDEERLGFTYAAVKDYVEGRAMPAAQKESIAAKHGMAKHKLEPITGFAPQG